jgi:hypothetical protein
LIVIGLILVALALRAHDLDARSLWIDEGSTFYRVTKDVAFILTNRIILDGVVTTDTQPPLYFILLRGFLLGAGFTPFAARLFSALVSLPSLSLLYLIGRHLCDEMAGLCAALVAALAPVYLWYSQEARPYALLITLSLLSMYALLRLVAPDGSRSDRVAWAAAYILATGVTVYTHYSGLFLLGFQGLFLLALVIRHRRSWLVPLLAGAGVLVMPIIPFIVHRMGTGAEKDYFFVPLRTILWDLANGFSLGLSVRAEQVWWLDGLFLLIALVGLVALARSGHWGWAMWIIGYLAVPILTLYVASYIKPMYMGVRHLLIISPAYYLALGQGLAALARWRRLALMAGLAIVVVGTGYSTRNYFTDPAYLKDDHQGLAEYLEEHVRPDDVVVVDGAVRAYVLDFYYDGLAPLVTLPRYGTESGPDTLTSLQTLAQRYPRIWFAYGVPGDDWVTPAGDRPIRTWREKALFQFVEKYFHGLDDAISLRGFLTGSPVLTQLPVQAVPVGADLGSQLELVGVEIPGKRQTSEVSKTSEVWEILATAAAGDPLDVILYWRARHPLEDYRVVLSLQDAQGHRWGMSDQMPYQGFFPPSEWPVGKMVAWRQSLQVDPTAPPGRYTLNLRVYDPGTGQALDLIGSDGNPAGQQVDLGQVIVTRPTAPARLPPGVPGHRLSARWADGIELLGYDQPVDTVAVGHPAPLDLYFVARSTSLRDLSLHLRLVDPAGREVASAVVPPVAAGYPISQWQLGDVLKGQHSLRLPASASPGRYTWCLRLEDERGEALPAHRAWWPFATREICLGTVRVEAPPLAPTPAVIPRPLKATFGDAIQLLGYDLTETTLRPGTEFSVTLFWQGEAPIAASYKVTVQLLSPKGKIVAQDDSVPANWTRPTTGWRPGEVITDEHRLMVDSRVTPGHYALIAALYDEATGQRLPVISGDQPADHILLAELLIEGG